jgi:hypothetical protein
MQNIRPKISSLTEKELANLLLASFFKVGKEFKISLTETKIFIDEIYKFQGSVYIDSFNEAFSMYAASVLPDAEHLRPSISPIFISKLLKIYFRSCNEKNSTVNPRKEMTSRLSPEDKCKLFIKHVSANKCLPANPDWISIYEHLTGLNKLKLPMEWDTLTYYKKQKYARTALSEWAYQNFTINENLIYKTIKR